MSEMTQPVSVVINAPAERVWPLLIDFHLTDEDKQFEPDEPVVPGQIMRAKTGCLRMTNTIDAVVQAGPPLIGQTIYSHLSFLGRRGEAISSRTRDDEQYHLQTRAEIKHPWMDIRSQSTLRCVVLDPTSCVVAYVWQTEMAFRFLPRWLTAQSGAEEKATREVIERAFHKIKAKAEQTSDDHPL
jgi:hypothetical protein